MPCLYQIYSKIESAIDSVGEFLTSKTVGMEKKLVDPRLWLVDFELPNNGLFKLHHQNDQDILTKHHIESEGAGGLRWRSTGDCYGYL